MNSLGAVAGAELTRIHLGPADSRLRRWFQGLRLPPRSALLCGLWLLWFAFPFIPRISMVVSLQQLTQPQLWSWPNLISAALGMAALRALLGRSPWIVVAFASVVGQPLLADRTLSYAWVVGAAIGWAVAAHSPFCVRLLGWLLPVWLLIDELRPWAFVGPPSPFSWSPFGSWYDSSAARFYTVIFGKFYLYTVIPWTMRATGIGWGGAVGIPVAILLVGEWAQRYLPGRTPELTDVVLLLAGLTLTWLIPESRDAQLRDEPAKGLAQPGVDRSVCSGGTPS